MSLVANLLMSPTVKNFENQSTFIKVMNDYQVARLLWPTVYYKISQLDYVSVHTISANKGYDYRCIYRNRLKWTRTGYNKPQRAVMVYSGAQGILTLTLTLSRI